jgi:hypothetical protein
MAYTMKTEGLEAVENLLNELGDEARHVAAFALYDGAAVMVKGVMAAARSIKTAPFKYAKTGQTRLPSPEEKQILLENGAMGISRFDKDGNGFQTSVGFNDNGYAAVNWNHMSSKGRTNYKDYHLAGRKSPVTSSGVAKSLGLGRRIQNVKPVGVIANAINSGTSFMKKQPFIRMGAAKTQAAAVAAITQKAEQMLSEIISENGGKSA